MQIRSLSLDDPAWTEALTRTPHDVYHTPEYVRNDARRIQAVGEAILVTDGVRQFFLPYLLRSCATLFPGVDDSVLDVVSPYGYPGILLNASGRDRQFVAAAWSATREQWAAQGACTAFLRMHPILGEGIDELFPPGTMLDSGETVAVNLLSDEETLWRQIVEGHRRSLRKCRRYGFAARFVPLCEVLDAFIDIYEQTMKRVHAKEDYFFSRDYFTSLAAMPSVHCCIVEFANAIGAACLFFESHGIVQAHLGGAASEYFTHSPFHLCIYQAMLWSKKRGNHWLHIGGGLGGRNDQLLKFKAGFSPLRFRFHTARVVLDESQHLRLVETAAAFTQRSPEDLLKATFFPAYRS